MDLDDALRRYREHRFTDDDVTRCTGLSVRGWRELIKHRAVRTVTERRGPGRVRLCDETVFKRATIIAALNKAGLSLAVAGRVAHFVPYHTLLFTVCDPLTILFQRLPDDSSKTGLPQRVEQPIVDWFDPSKLATADPDNDWLIEIYEGRYVAALINGEAAHEPIIFGDLREQGTRFVGWFPFQQQSRFTGGGIGKIAQDILPYRFIDFIREWDDPTKWRKELKSIGYDFERHDDDSDPLLTAAAAATCSPTVTTTINITLALRRALRSYLGLDANAAHASAEASKS